MSGATRSEPSVKKQRSPLWAKIMIGFGAVLMVVAGGGAVYAKTFLDQIDDSVEQTDLLGDGDVDPDEEITGPLNLLMIGTDMRVNDSDGEDRADSIMILHINEDLSEANIISIPRDLKVPIQDCGDDFDSPCEYKINSSYQNGGETPEKRFTNLAKTLSDLTGIDSFDGAAVVGFEGFLKAVETMGSIELCLPFDMQLEQQMLEEPENPRTFEKGCNEYDQQEALWIVRERYAYDASNPEFDPSYGVGDYGRQHMQQHFIKQLLKKAGEEGYTTNPDKVGGLISDIGETLTLDLNGRKMSNFAFEMRNIQPSDLETIRLPSESVLEYPNGIEESFEVIPEADQQVADDLFEALRNDTLDEWIAENPKLLNKDK